MAAVCQWSKGFTWSVHFWGDDLSPLHVEMFILSTELNVVASKQKRNTVLGSSFAITSIDLTSALHTIANFPRRSSNAAWLEWLIYLQLQAGIVNTTDNPRFHAARKWINLGGTIHPAKNLSSPRNFIQESASFWTNVVWDMGLVTRMQMGLEVFHLLHCMIENRWLSMMTLHCSPLRATKRYIIKSMFWMRVG